MLFAGVGSGEMGHPMIFNEQVTFAAFGHGADRGCQAKLCGIIPGNHGPFHVMVAQGLLTTEQDAQPYKLVGVAAQMSLRQRKRVIK